MEVSVAAALKQVGEPFRFELTETVEPVHYGGRAITFVAPLQVSGTYVFDGKGFQLEAHASTVLRSICARCAAAFDEPYTFSINECFAKASEIGPDDEVYPYLGDRLNIQKAVMDNLFLQLPLTSVCKPDCKGLCPVCGADRNKTACNCQPNGTDSPFAALSALEEEE